MDTSGELLKIGDFELLSDITMMTDGTALRDMLLPVRKLVPQRALSRKSHNGGRPTGTTGPSKINSVFTESEIAENPLLALSPEELLTLRLYMQGYAISWIARNLGQTETNIRWRLNKDHVREAKRYITAGHDEDMSALYGKAIAALQTGLDDHDKEHRLKCADRVLKAIGKDGVAGRNKKDSDELGGVEEMLSVVMETAKQSMGLENSGEASRKTLKIDYKKRLQLSED